MYIFTPEELRQIHDERIGQLLENNIPTQKEKMNQKPRKWSLKSLLSVMKLN